MACSTWLWLWSWLSLLHVTTSFSWVWIVVFFSVTCDHLQRGSCYHIYIFQPGFHDATCRLTSFCIPHYFYMGYQHGPLELHSTSEPCLYISLPGLRLRSPLRWFWWWSSSFQQRSRSRVGTHSQGLINWRQVYMVRSGIFPWFSFAQWCISDTCACHVRMIVVTYCLYVLYCSNVCYDWSRNRMWRLLPMPCSNKM